MTGQAYKREKLWKNKGASWCNLRGCNNKNPSSKSSKYYKRYGLLAEQQIIINSEKISERDD